MAQDQKIVRFTDEDVRFVIEYWIKFDVIQFSAENWNKLEVEFNIWKRLPAGTIGVSVLKSWYISKVDSRLNEFFRTGVSDLFVDQLTMDEKLELYCERLRQVRTIYEYEHGMVAEKVWTGVKHGERVPRSSLKINHPVYKPLVGGAYPMDVNSACRPLEIFFGIEFVVLKDDASVLDCVLSRSYSDIIELHAGVVLDFCIADDLGENEFKLAIWIGIASENDELNETVAGLFPQLKLYKADILKHLVKRGQRCGYSDFEEEESWLWTKIL